MATPTPQFLCTHLFASIQPNQNKLIETEKYTRASGVLIVNADDWGRDEETTDRILDCVLHGSVSSASAMVFMEDSARAAHLARDKKVDVGLHLNFTSPYSDRKCQRRLLEHQQRLANFLLRSRYAQVVFHPGLVNAFEYVVAAQIDEFRRLYGREPGRIDGHHHMHLCANVLLGNLIPGGTVVRRSFSFARGEKSWINRSYRLWIDRWLKKRYRLVDLLFPLAPVGQLERLRNIVAAAQTSVVELETHPVNPDEYRFLATGEIYRQLSDIRIAPRFLEPGLNDDSNRRAISQ